MREAKNLIIKIANPNSNENIEHMNQCLHVVEDVRHSLHKSTETKDTTGRTSNATIMDHSGFHHKFDMNFVDDDLGNYSYEQLSNDKYEGAIFLKKCNHVTPTKHKLLQKTYLALIFKVSK